MELQRIYKTTFESGHFIEGHPKCGVQHGHSYHLSVYLNGDSQTWYDFADLKKTVDDIINTKYDHQFLGSRTAEQIAEEIGTSIRGTKFIGQGTLELYETDKFGVKLNF